MVPCRPRKLNSDLLLLRVFQNIDEHRMIQPEDSVLLAVSGGVDSVVLTDILFRYCQIHGILPGVAHLNHGLRGHYALRDARFVRELALAKGMAFYYGKGNVEGYRRASRLSIEEAGRQLRYRFLTRTAMQYGFSRIATGHHLDDNAEVMLMRILSGSGRLGLSGIPLIRDGYIIRPLLGLSRNEINAYAAALGLRFVEDETNSDDAYLRNRIRHRLIPFLKETFNPGLHRALGRLALISADEDHLLNEIGEKALKDAIVSELNNSLTISRSGMRQNGAAIQRRMLRAAISRVKGDTRGFGLHHIELIRRLLESKEYPKTLHLPGRILAICDGRVLTLTLSPVSHRVRFARVNLDEAITTDENGLLTVSGPGMTALTEINGVMRFTVLPVHDLRDLKALPAGKAFLDFDAMAFPLIVRRVRPNDRFCPLGMQGNQTVLKFLAYRKVPEKKRRTWPVLLWKDRIVWVPGHRIDQAFRVTDHTQKVLSVELSLA